MKHLIYAALLLAIAGLSYIAGLNRMDARMKLAWAFRDQSLDRLLFGPAS